MSKPLILCVDDEQIVLNSLQMQLRKNFSSHFEIETSTSPEEALVILAEALLERQDVPVVVSDYIMPGMKGDAFLAEVEKLSKDTLKVLLTGQATLDGVTNAINHANLFRYLSKPWEEADLVLTINKASETYFQKKEIIDLSIKNKSLYNEMKDYFVSSIQALSNAIDARDKYTVGHSNRVTIYSLWLGKLAGLSEERLEWLEYMATLHDVGKIGIPDHILHKNNSLSDEEFDIMKTHVTIGADIIKHIAGASKIVSGVLYHHEKMDGTGYPGVLKGLDIPLEARIICIADAFDAMTSDRPYRKGMPKEYALSELQKHAGKQFDKHLVELFCQHVNELKIG